MLAPAVVGQEHRMNSISEYSLSTFVYAPARWQVLAHGGGGIPGAIGDNPFLILLVPGFILSMLISCFRHARHADLIFANWSVCGVIAGVVGRIKGIPVVTTIRGEDANRIEVSVISKSMIKWCLRLNKKVVTVSDEMSAQIRQVFPEYSEKVLSIANGVAVADVSNSRHVRYSGTDVINIVTVGSLIPRKSVATALHGMVNLSPEYRLTVIGDGPERDYLERLAYELGVNNRVRFFGHVSPGRINEMLREADIFILTSHAEGRPNSVLEAMAESLPVVGTDIAGVRELVIPGVTGYLVPVDDHNSLAESIKKLSDPNVRVMLGNAGSQEIISRGLTWDRSAELYMKQFESTASGE